MSAKSFYRDKSNFKADSYCQENQILRPILTAKIWKLICMILEITVHPLPLTTSMMHLMSLQQ